MKLAIFGDSWGDDHSLWPRYYKNVGDSWIDYLGYNTSYEITNFCVGGSSFFFQYERLLNHHENFDKIIFLIPSAGRIHSKVRDTLEHWGTVEQVHRAIANFTDLTFSEKEHLQAIEKYFAYIQDVNKDKTVQTALLQNIKSFLRPDIKFISVSPDSCFEDSSTNNLHKLAFIEPTFFDVDAFSSKTNYYDARKCHLSEENNLILGKKVLEFLENNVPLDLNFDHFCHTPTMPLDHYFRPHWNKLK